MTSTLGRRSALRSGLAATHRGSLRNAGATLAFRRTAGSATEMAAALEARDIKVAALVPTTDRTGVAVDLAAQLASTVVVPFRRISRAASR